MNPTLSRYCRDAQDFAERTLQLCERAGLSLTLEQKQQHVTECITAACQAWTRLQAVLYGRSPAVIIDLPTGKYEPAVITQRAKK